MMMMMVVMVMVVVMMVGRDDDDDDYDDDGGGDDEEKYKKTLSMTSLIFNYFQAHHILKIITTDLLLQSVIEPIQGKTKMPPLPPALQYCPADERR